MSQVDAHYAALPHHAALNIPGERTQELVLQPVST